MLGPAFLLGWAHTPRGGPVDRRGRGQASPHLLCAGDKALPRSFAPTSPRGFLRPRRGVGFAVRAGGSAHTPLTLLL